MTLDVGWSSYLVDSYVDNSCVTGVIANYICSSGFFARANHRFYRFRTVFCVWNVVQILRSFNFSFCIFFRACVRARVRARVRACGLVSSYGGLFLFVSTQIRNNPPDFFQNTNTGSL